MAKFLSKDGKFYMRDGKLLGYTPPPPIASLTPKSGITYTSGLSGIGPATLTLFSQAISNNAAITNTTNTVYVDYEQTHVKIDVGNQVTIDLNGTNYAFDVIGFNHDTLTDVNAYGSATVTGKAGITFQMHDLFATVYQMNSSNTNSGGWKSSAMRTSTMATMKGYMPAEWQTAIKVIDKKSGLGDGSSSGTETTSDECFLLAELEIYDPTYKYIRSVSGEGTQYAYYKAGNSMIKNRDGTAKPWWERSPNSGNRNRFCLVRNDGESYPYAADYSCGVAFGFCI